jgi:hypothetical protein
LGASAIRANTYRVFRQQLINNGVPPDLAPELWALLPPENRSAAIAEMLWEITVAPGKTMTEKTEAALNKMNPKRAAKRK